jgi:type IX secretion system PorP/SprF family membrane protein
MKRLKNIITMLFLLFAVGQMNAQDPVFSQFFSSPLNVNPALTANINEKWRLISNYRNQWIGPGNPYQTGTVSFDNKILQNLVGNYVDENTRIGMGGMMMYDQGMAGAYKSNYASLNISGNIRLAAKEGYEITGGKIRHLSKIKMDQGAEHRLGVGLGLSYGHKRLDYSKLDFEEQFTGFGFNTNLPTGEAALGKMKGYISTNAGIVYTYKKDNTNFDLGLSGYHFNKPKQTFLEDGNQYLAPRYVAHANLETFISDQVILITNGIYQKQSGTSYFSIGGALGYYLPSEEADVIVNAGLWYWSANAVIPYIGFSYGDFQFGFTYDITISQLNQAPKHANTFEISLILRGGEKKMGGIPAPWK